MKLLVLLLSLVNGFLLNNPISIYKKDFQSSIIKVYEPKLLDKKNMTSIVFYSGANSIIPADVYSNFIKSLNNFNFSVSVVTNNNEATTEFLYSIKNDYKEIIALSHSSGCVNAINTINKQDNIKKAVFLDPVDNNILFDFNLFSMFKNKNTFNYLTNLLVLNAEKSYKGSIYPKLEIPFIPAFALKTEELEKINPFIKIDKISAPEHGHSDVLDTLWSDLMHATLSKGTENRDQDNLDNYLIWLAQQIYYFINDININDNNDEDVSRLLISSSTSDYEE